MRILGLMFCMLVAAPAALAQVSIDEKPRTYMEVQAEGASRTWQIRPIRITNTGGRPLPGANEGDFKLLVERWERTGMPRRYDVSLWKAAAAKYLKGGNESAGGKFYFYAIDPKQPRADGVITLVDEKRRIYWAQADKIEVKAYPQTWVNVYEAYVTRQNGDARRGAVVDWEKAHADIITNKDTKEGWFSQEERNEFARFYQAQFVFVRDREPTSPDNYAELARFHKQRGNLDAELSTYLDALRAGVTGEPRQEFALEVGRIFVYRLNLGLEAIPYLEQARGRTEALYLMARCQLDAGRYEPARAELTGLIATLNALPADGSVKLQSTAAEELGRAHLTLAELEYTLMNYKAAEAAIGLIPKDNPSWDAGQVLACGMLLQRAEPKRDGETKTDFQKIRDTLKTLSFWQAAMALTTPTATGFPLDPLMAKAMLLYAQTDQQYSNPRPIKPEVKPSAEALRFLNAAKALDPLSAEPHYAEGRLYQRLGLYIEAAAAYQAGLDLDPRHVLLSFAMADLNLKAGRDAVAKDYLGRCLKYAPEFYPAHTLLGEIAVSEVEDVRQSLLLRYNAGEPVDFGGELVPPMKAAAAFYTSSLTIKPGQPATKQSLATLYLQLSEFAPLTVADLGESEAVKRAYLLKAKDLASELIAELEAFAKSKQPPTLTDREKAAVPSLACFNVYGYTLYALGDYDGALDAFKLHVEKSRDKLYLPDDTARRDYATNPAMVYATEWVNRIEQNQRQYFRVDDFAVASDISKNFHGTWIIPTRLKPDQGFTKATGARGGRLHLAVEQKTSGAVSRFETEQPHNTLSVFEANFVQVGEHNFDYGIHITRVGKQQSTESKPLASLLVGIDFEGRVFWETRRYDLEATEVEKRLDFGYVDVGAYGGLPLKPTDKLTMALRRQYNKDRSRCEYVLILNGYEIRLPINENKDTATHVDDLTRIDFGSPNYALHCGFFTRGGQGSGGTVEVESAKFIYDGGLVRKK